MSAEYGESSPEFIALMKDPKIIDPDLHPVGVAQSEANAPKMAAINFKYVLVSPMKRALQTCIHMFKTHPNRENIRFIVEPWFHEIMHTMCDVPMDADELIQKYAPGQPICHGINFDWSRVQEDSPNLWCPKTIIVEEKKAKFFQKLQERGGEPTGENVLAVLVDMVSSELPEGALETKDDMYNRS
mmetsp:Transcript_29735/g.36903  ORF Transcript_29735/g.36903 Transcript_29735/m.36903 type:complete len:186 (-) Transcript_29735:223-780(-)|eukprot:CAMPEP_0170470802 /NCGR_PEP_ID=MMETSP0123-20130129/13164_1 /TAXON_ID=182087 /ORGANISM="Favella ehrenbergii, Strain Fehren 1" /LENGTH=185 /DNA_ID=CAMNT_0010738099 /DNA_START=81 /DNA_END=638 /DNA_ORIENTATION=-